MPPSGGGSGFSSILARGPILGAVAEKEGWKLLVEDLSQASDASQLEISNGRGPSRKEETLCLSSVVLRLEASKSN